MLVNCELNNTFSRKVIKREQIHSVIEGTVLNDDIDYDDDDDDNLGDHNNETYYVCMFVTRERERGSENVCVCQKV